MTRAADAAQCGTCVQQPWEVRINSFPRGLTLTPVQSGSRGEGELLPKHRHHTLLIRADRLLLIRAGGSREGQRVCGHTRGDSGSLGEPEGRICEQCDQGRSFNSPGIPFKHRRKHLEEIVLCFTLRRNWVVKSRIYTVKRPSLRWIRQHFISWEQSNMTLPWG